MKKSLLVLAIVMAAVFARAQLMTPWKAPVECDIPTVANLYGSQMSAKAVASTASQRSVKTITPTASQMWWGYFSESNVSSLDFSGNLGYSSAVTLNAAIMVEGSNSFVKGSTIKAVRFWLGDDLSAINSNLTVWISKSLPTSASAADYTQTIPKANISTRLNEVELTTPYDATSMQSGDKLYIGFSFSISGKAYPIMSGGIDMPGGFYYNTGSSWIDFVGEGYGYGNLALQLLLDGGTYPNNCASIDNLGQKVVKSGSSVSIPCKITNKGIDDITSLEFTIKDANGSTQTVTRTLSNSLALNSSTDISLSFDAASTVQKSDISVTVTKVNGVDNTLSASDGLKTGTGTLITVSSSPTVVPVVEEFTGTWCGYCPYGTVAMQKAHQQYGDEIVQIAIHSGDPMAVSDYSPVISAYCNGYPNATIDRLSTFHAASIPYYLTSAFNRVSQGKIELTAQWTDAGKTAVKFNTKSTFGYSDSNGQYGVVLLLTEDGMTGTTYNWSQSNYLSGKSGDSDMQFWYDSPSTVSGLEYDHVAVAVWNALYGADGSIPSSFTADTPIEYNFTGSISSNTLIQDKTKLKAVALLIDRVSGNIVNAAQCSINEDNTPDDTPEAYAALSDNNTVLTFYYDTNKENRNGMSVGPFNGGYINDVYNAIGREWNDYVSTITKAVFDASFAEYRPTSTAYWFYDCEALANITGIENLKTDEATDMSYMFSGCSNLTSLDMSNFKTDNVTSMSSMFSGCSNLTSLDLSKFNTSNVKRMNMMFRGCSSLTNLDLSNFKTDNVTSMNRMFINCSGLTNLDVSNFNTSNVTVMEAMFSGCSNLTTLDVSKFNTSNVTGMAWMFSNCSSLTNLDLSNFNTSNVTTIRYMFSNCSKLTNIDVSNFNTANVTTMAALFYGCSSLTNLDVSNFNTSNVTDMSYMFLNSSGMTTIKVDADNWSTSNVTDSENMFSGCTSLVGGKGTTYDANHTDASYAHIDGGTSNPGYLTDVNAPQDNVAISAKSYTRVYGEENPKFEYDVTEGTITSGEPNISCEATTKSPVGSYDIVIEKGTVTNSNVELTNGTLTITKAPLTVSGGTYTMKQGDTLPEFAAEYDGFKNGETSEVLTKQPVMTTSATSTSEPGTYEIAVSGAEAGNYEISYVAGTLTIMEADPVKVTAKSYTIEYGESIPAFEYSSEGAALSGTPEIRCAATAASAAGTYDIVISKGSVSNFNDTYVNGTLIITKAPLTIKAKSYTIKQGDALPEFKVEYEGFKNGETSDVLTKQPVLTTSATSTSEPGTYDIIASGAEAENYEISYVKGTLTITDTEPVKVTAKSYTIEYGESIPAFEYTSEGASLRGVPEIRCAATAGSAAGTYDIVISKGSVSNFNDTYVNGTLTITKAPLVISVGEYTRQEGEENPEFELSYEGFKNGETDGVLTKLPVVTCSATKDSEPGEYVITIDGAEAENYDIRYAPGKLTVTPKPLPEITPIEGEISVNTEGLSEADLTDNVVNDVYYNVGEQGYDAAEKSIVISEATNMAQIADKEPGSKDVKESFNGIILKVGKGFGLITISAKTSGNAQLVVQVGQNGMPMIASRTEKGDVVVSYDVSEDTYVYIYSILGSSAAKLMYGDINDTDTDSSVRIYGITVSPGATGIRSVNGNDNGNGNDDAYYTIDGKKLDAAPKKGGIYVKQGRKVVK